MSRIPVIGLVGGVGSGKSTLARRLAQRRNLLVLDADQFGHQALKLDTVKQQIRERFGDEVFDERGEIVRAKLGRVVFGPEAERQQARRDLEEIVHPEITQAIRQRVAEARRSATLEAILLDAAVLLEAGWRTFCDAVVFVETPFDERVRRVAATRGWDAAELLRREASQLSIDEKQRQSDFVVHNSGRLERAVDELEMILSRVVADRP